MWTLKYFDGIKAAQAADRAKPQAPLGLFDFGSLATGSRFAQRFSRFVFRRVMPATFAVLRTVCPNLRIGRLVIVTREADVRAVLRDEATFPTCYALEMTELGGNQNSVLGMAGEEHARLRTVLHEHLKSSDLAEIARLTEAHATALIGSSGGRIDVMRDLITRCATEVCCTYLGVTAGDPDTFAEWTMAVSSMLFGDPFGDANARRQGTIAAAHLRAAFDDAVARVDPSAVVHARSPVVDRLVTEAKMPPDLARASLLGLATALIPTNTLACGNVLEQLLGDRELMEEAVKAAKAPDKAALEAALLKAARFNPALSPGQWRSVACDGVIAPGTRRARKVRADDVVLVAVMSALRDGRVAPEVRNDPTRAAWLMFGDGPHVCLGAQIAMTQMVATFAVLLRLPGLAQASDRDGFMVRTGPFPTRLDMVFDDPLAGQSMIVIASPVRDGCSVKDLSAEIDKLGNPANEPMATAMRATGLVHFCSLSAIEAEPDSAGAILLLEINADGGRDRAIGAVADKGFASLAPIYAHCRADGAAPADGAALAALLRPDALDLHTAPWGATGLNFNGTEEFSVADIDRQEELATFARKALAQFFASNLGRSTRAMDALGHVRRFLKQDGFHALPAKKWETLFEAARPVRYAIVRPSRRRLKLADWVPPKTIWSPVGSLAASPSFRPFWFALAALYLGITLSIGWNEWPTIQPTVRGWFWAIAGALAGGLLATLVVVAVALAVLIATLRWKEVHDPVDERAPDLARIRDIARREDAPGYEQNHIIAVMPFKPGFFRRLAFAFSMWGIKQSVAFWFRPGFVVTMGTIHKAKWFRVRGTDQFVFLSNYDGSWESYLEDFVTRAHPGQSAAWGNGVGFPRTRFLILDGAADGDRFKRWVRRQQRPTSFWFSRYPHLTTKQIRNNAMIEDGLARAANDTDARRWLTNFGSAQREDGELESHESQAILFTGFGKQLHATSLFVRLPKNSEPLGTWLEAVSGIVFSAPPAALIGVPSHWMLKLTPSVVEELASGLESWTERADDDGAVRYQLPPEAQVVFGDRPVDLGGLALGLTAAGLRRCGVKEGTGLEGFPAAFLMGMAGRRRLLGDGEAEGRPWDDGDAGEAAVDAVITVYGSEPQGNGDRDAAERPAHDRELRELAAHERLVGNHRVLLEILGGEVVSAVPCSPVEGSKGAGVLRREHFGFRDGISQPVIRGSQRTGQSPAPRDVIAAGEFVLGYRNDQGYFSPPIPIGAERDVHNSLPTVSATGATRFPRYGDQSPQAELRDFGRNGSFMVIRQLDQDVDGFAAAVKLHADALSNKYRDLAAFAGARIDASWVAAKIIGRWQNGSPLVGNPTEPGRVAADEVPANDFAYGVDDPRGLQCPLGAHIRRTNPRDSLEPGDVDEQRITNRHRLLRRGRSYDYAAEDGKRRRGLLFTALCADIERQFEFVQRTWSNSTSFHGLTGEPDPLLGSNAMPVGKFTIPTPPGPIQIDDMQTYVTLRAGGYFFLPSRAAFQFMIGASP